MTDTIELYNLKYSISKFLVPRLIEFKEIYEKNSSPTVPEIHKEEIKIYLGDVLEEDYLSFKEKEKIWIKILDDMIFAFEYQIKEDKSKNHEETLRRVERGLNLFAKYFSHLWI